QLHAGGGAAMRPASRSGVGLDPGDAAELDALFGQRLRFVAARLAIDAVRIGLAVMDAARLLGKALADIIAVLFDLPAHFHQRGAHLRPRYRRALLARAGRMPRHPAPLDPGRAPFPAG